MDKPTITPESVAQYKALSEQVRTFNQQSSAALAVAKLNQDAEMTIMRQGKEVSLRERLLWEEVWNLGMDSEAGAALANKYPQVFEAAKAAEARREEMKAFAISQWGIDPLAMSLADIIMIVEGVCRYTMKQGV